MKSPGSYCALLVAKPSVSCQNIYAQGTRDLYKPVLASLREKHRQKFESEDLTRGSERDALNGPEYSARP